MRRRVSTAGGKPQGKNDTFLEQRLFTQTVYDSRYQQGESGEGTAVADLCSRCRIGLQY